MPNDSDPLKDIVKHYEACLEQHGVCPKGVDWPNAKDLEVRFDVMLSPIGGLPERSSVLDLGCGPGLMLDYIDAIGRREEIAYTGVDISGVMIETAKGRWPDETFIQRDVVGSPFADQEFDFVLMNGVLTEKRQMSYAEMKGFARGLIETAFSMCRFGIAFNAMSKHVEWERQDLFHWPLDEVAAFLTSNISRHFTIRHDYGLYEYTVYVFREPVRNGVIKESKKRWWER